MMTLFTGSEGRPGGRGAAAVAVLAGLALACAVAPLMADGAVVRRHDADPLVAALLDGRGSLSFALFAGLLGGALGVGWGVLATALGRRAERRLMSTATRLTALPLVLLVPLAAGLLGGGVGILALTVALAVAPAIAGLTHAELNALMRREFLTAARAAGLSEGAILRRHLIPNARRPLLAAGALALPRALAAESFAGLLGLGLPAPLGSWGASAGLAARLGDPVALAAPALLLAVSLWALCAFADSLRPGHPRP
ncbi:ABC transporter permease subunit [Azospirillum doebereinerae]|uniref:ABC transporter permease subunit n=1 Tax=Azospirillum doebereinerae TaxID=92933 RepID=A0A433JBL2_9PROT|nr:ABC transporter permease subunit [Azospirillum doebereinerae]RUQ73813.1 ABC transporter permease subunit [Azospirillum doebereinerae]